MDEHLGAGMQRHVTSLAAFARHLEMRHAFGACRKDGPAALATQAVVHGCGQLGGPMDAERRRKPWHRRVLAASHVTESIGWITSV